MLEKFQNLLGSEVRENEPLSNHVTFKIGGPAKYFYIANNSQDLEKACRAADELGVEYRVLGLGSNVLVSDQGFDGLVIKLKGGKVELNGQNMYAEAGADLQEVVKQSTEAGLTGAERLAGIPSSVAGAVRGNAGAFGQEIRHIVKDVTVYHKGETKTYDNAACQFAYRDSIFKHQPGVQLYANLHFEKGEGDMVVAAKETLKKREHLPTEPSAGCIFKNIELANVEVDKERVKRALDISEEEWQENTKYGKLPVGYILDRLGYRGKKMGGIQVSDKHCAYMVNVDHGTAEHVMILISEIKMQVRNKLGIQLQEEVQFFGF